MLHSFIKNFLKWIVIPTALLFIGILFSIIYFFNTSGNRNVLLINEPDVNIRSTGKVISGKFTARENYLGMISVRFNNETPLAGDSIFRIKNALDNNWFLTATVSAFQYTDLPLFMFGFPTIEKSKKKTYQFEVRLDKKSQGNLILSKESPVLISQYQFPEQVLSSNRDRLINFTYRKLLYSFFDKATQGVWLFFSLPFVLYLFFIIFKIRLIPDQVLSLFSKPCFFLISLFAAVSLFILPGLYDQFIIVFVLLWLAVSIAYDLRSSHTFGIAFILLTMLPLLVWANMETIVLKTGVWAYAMFGFGIISLIFEINPVLQKLTKTKLVKFLVSFLKFFILDFDQLIFWTIRATYQNIIIFITFVFKTMPNTIRDWIIFALKLILLAIVSLTIFIIILLILHNTYRVIQVVNHKKARISMNPIIDTIEPKLVYKGTKVIIYGNKFGWDTKKSKAFIDGELINPVLWQDSKIIFPIPLHWTNGNHRIWIEKQINWDGKNVIAKSEAFEIKILPVGSNFTDDDKLYLDQLKTLRKETLKLNGY